MRHRRRLSIALLVLGAAGWSLAPALFGLQGSVSLIVGAASAALVELVGVLWQQHVRRHNVRSVLATIHTGVGGLDPVDDLGLRRSALAIRAQRGSSTATFAAYVPGDVDDRLDRALAGNGLVLVTGNSLAGKSRAAFEAIRRLRPSPIVLVPDGLTALDGLLKLDPPMLDTWRPIVVWLGDLCRFSSGLPGQASSDRGIAPMAWPTPSAALIARHLTAPKARFLGRSVRVVFIATMSAREYDLLTKGGEVLSSGSTAFSLTTIVRAARRVHLEDGEKAGWDMDVARRLYPSVDFSPGIGRAFSEAELLVNTYRFGLQGVTQAVVRACVDWRRIGAGNPTVEQLERAVSESLSESILTSEDIAAGLREANREIGSGQHLVGRAGPQAEPRFHAHDCLVDADDGYGVDADSRPIPASTWEIALEGLSGPKLLEVAEAAVARGSLDAADRIWTAILEGSVPEAGIEARARVYLDRAEAFEDTSPERAREDLDEVIGLTAAPAATRAAAYHARGSLYLDDDERYDEVEADYTKAIEMPGVDPEVQARALTNRGVLRMGGGDESGAEADFEAALAIPGASGNPRSHALAIRGILRLNQGAYDLAEADCAAALELGGIRLFARAYALLGLGEVKARDGQPREAEANFTAAIDLAGFDPDLSAAWCVRRGDFYFEEDRLAEAAADFETVLKRTLDLSPDTRAAAYVGRARTREIERTEEGVEDCTTAIEIGEASANRHADAYFTRGRLKALQGKFAAAEQDLTTAIEFPGADPGLQALALLSRGNVHYEQNGHLDAAEADYTAVIDYPGAEADTRAIAFYDRGMTHFRRGCRRSAEMDFRESLKVPSRASSKAMSALTDLLRGDGRKDEEIAFYESAAASGRKDLVPFAMARLEAHQRVSSRRERRRL